MTRREGRGGRGRRVSRPTIDRSIDRRKRKRKRVGSGDLGLPRARCDWSRNSRVSREATWTYPVRHGGGIVRVRLRALVRLVRRRILLVPCGFLGGYRVRLRHRLRPGPRRGLRFRHHPTKRCPPAFLREENGMPLPGRRPSPAVATRQGMCAVVERFTRYTNTRAIASPDGQARARLRCGQRAPSRVQSIVGRFRFSRDFPPGG